MTRTAVKHPIVKFLFLLLTASYKAFAIIVAFIFTMVFIGVLLLHSFVDDDLKEMEIQQLIEKG
ncbi:MAG: hypothetical protein P8L91_01825, partial [Candidatus Marinimicrobia bacterium]|nr:hypothetical protein [Candidatus Neomarinimicrobiota bacterium]